MIMFWGNKKKKNRFIMHEQLPLEYCMHAFQHIINQNLYNYFRVKGHFGLYLLVVEMAQPRVRATQITYHHPLNL